MQRLDYGRTVEEIKVAMAFFFTMSGVPFVYYVDEKVLVTKLFEFKGKNLCSNDDCCWCSIFTNN